jgi:hypothetical protein
MFLIHKGADSFRAVVDYRLLNQRIEVESTPLPDKLCIQLIWKG